MANPQGRQDTPRMLSLLCALGQILIEPHNPWLLSAVGSNGTWRDFLVSAPIGTPNFRPNQIRCLTRWMNSGVQCLCWCRQIQRATSPYIHRVTASTEQLHLYLYGITSKQQRIRRQSFEIRAFRYSSRNYGCNVSLDVIARWVGWHRIAFASMYAAKTACWEK